MLSLLTHVRSGGYCGGYSTRELLCGDRGVRWCDGEGNEKLCLLVPGTVMSLTMLLEDLCAVEVSPLKTLSGMRQGFCVPCSPDSKYRKECMQQMVLGKVCENT